VANNGARNGNPATGNGINRGPGNGNNAFPGSPDSARTGMYRMPAQQGNGYPGAMPQGYEGWPARGQGQPLHPSPDQAAPPGQPAPVGHDHQGRATYGQQHAGPPALQQYAGQPSQPGHPSAQVAQPVARSPQPVARSPLAVAISLTDAIKAAHGEGYSFGESVSRDAPGLWLEAVLARKPRMPSDLEARLLQGSVLPIDSLLNDEVRHSLRRGFWDALESTRR
jgi:hypothetical protein